MWARYLKTSRPDVYEAIGRGANAATGMSVVNLDDEVGQPDQQSIR